MRAMVTALCLLASSMAHADAKRPPFANVNVSPPAPRPVKPTPSKPEKPEKPAKPPKPPTTAEVAFAERVGACQEVLAIARRVDHCIHLVTVMLNELDKQPPPARATTEETDRMTELVQRPLDAKRDAETAALCIRERARLERLEKQMCWDLGPVGCYF